MRLAGDIHLGQQSKFDRSSDHVVGDRAPMTLIYGEPQETLPVPIFGAYCHDRSLEECPPPAQFSVAPRNSRSAYFSRAPLGRVSSACIFRDSSGVCKGIMFCYLNGSSRTVGQCRLHVDAAEWTLRPTTLCFRSSRATSGLRAEFKNIDGTHEHEEGGWHCFPLKGILEFSFDCRSSRPIQVVRDETDDLDN